MEDNSPSERRQEAPQDPDAEQGQDGNDKDASEQLQRQCGRHMKSPFN
jgi:hypothetical protein